MEKGHFGQYTGNARHSRTPVTKRNYRASVADDAAHIHYLEEDMKYDKKHHSPFKQMDEREGDTQTQELDEVVVTLPEMHKRNLGMYDPGAPKFKKGISGRYQFRSASGGVDPNPSKAFTRGLGDSGVQGAPGRSFTQEEVEEIQNRYNTYIQPKKQAQAYFKSQS